MTGRGAGMAGDKITVNLTTGPDTPIHTAAGKRIAPAAVSVVKRVVVMPVNRRRPNGGG